MNNFLATSGGAAVVASLFIQYLKKSNWFTFLSTEEKSSRANMVFSILVAIISSLGVTFSYNTVTHSATIGGLDPTGMLTLGLHAFVQWVAQHVAYKTVVVPTELQGMAVAALKQITAQLEVQKK